MKKIHYQTIDSTNEAAKRLISGGEITETTVITADTQTAGKGTQGRVWVSEAGTGVYLSMVHLGNQIGSQITIPTTTDYTVAAAEACIEALDKTVGLRPTLKPINDLYVDGRKLGGILVESLVQQGLIYALVTGVGVNVKPVSLPLADERNTPVSLEEVLPPHQMERFFTDALIEAMVQQIDVAYTRIFQNATGTDACLETSVPE
ncbi:MAG: biotin--[acetyl-CoA-carboxylase] ligase [Vampirovibrio sp.]|nr:biotin--[acetyl-CoA-carboxylase] ligase [Vampirovibrio sp.]